MKYCRKCGNQIEDEAIICPKCGCSQEVAPLVERTVDDNGGFGWFCLGCCIPVVGLVLFLVWHDNRPNTAKTAGMGALISVILSALYYVVIFGMGIGLGWLGI